MSYCTQTQLEGELKVSTAFSSSTNPTDTKVLEIIAEEDQHIDSRIGVRYAVPVTDATDLLIIRKIALQLCVERVRGVAQTITGKKEEGQDPLSSAGKTGLQMLNEIVTGEVTLLNTTKRNAHDAVKDYNYANDIEGSFKTDEDQW